MLKIIEERIKKQKEYIELAKKYVQQLAKTLSVKKAYVIGSVARGDFNDASDIDVLIIAENLPVNPLKRLHLLYETVPPLIEPKAFTPEEFKMLLEKKNPLAVETRIRGIRIYP